MGSDQLTRAIIAAPHVLLRDEVWPLEKGRSIVEWFLREGKLLDSEHLVFGQNVMCHPCFNSMLPFGKMVKSLAEVTFEPETCGLLLLGCKPMHTFLGVTLMKKSGTYF